MKKSAKTHFKRVVSILVLFTFTFAIIPKTKILAERSNKVNFQNLPITENFSENNYDETFGKTPVYFEENQGQFDKKVKYFARGTSGYSLFLTATEAVYVLQKQTEVQKPKSDELFENPTNESRKAVAVYMKLAGANKDSNSVGLEQMPHKTNYFKGTEENWRTEIPNFRQIRMNDVYQGIDTVWHGKENGEVQYDFVIEPSANPMNIEWEIEGAESVEIDIEGNLLIKTEFGEIKQAKPFSFQDDSNGFRQEVESRFTLNDVSQNSSQNLKTFKIGFEIGDYDRTKTLTIDPTVNLSNLAYFKVMNGSCSCFHEATSLANDNLGNLYFTGRTNDNAFPTTPGTFDRTINGGSDVVVTKLNRQGSIIYSTFLGSQNDDLGKDIAVDQAGNVYVAGVITQVSLGPNNFPTTPNAFDRTYNGLVEGFVTKINSSGSALIYSTYLGGNSTDIINGITINSSGEVYVTGSTFSDDFPTTSGVFDRTPNGAIDAFVTKFDVLGQNLIFSTYIGGASPDSGNDIEIGLGGSVFITGYTSSSDFPTTNGSFDTTFNGDQDAFVTRLSASGINLTYSTFIGGSAFDEGTRIAVSLFDAYIIGSTSSNNFPTTPSSYDVAYNGASDVFVTRINASGSALQFSTYLGGTGNDDGKSIDIDSSGNAYITGSTGSPGFPTTPGAYDTTYNFGFDAFVTKISSTGSILDYSSFFGESTSDYFGNGIELDKFGNVLVVGQRNLSSSPFTERMFILKFGTNLPSSPFDFDGDGRTDVSIFRPSVGQWWYLRSSDNDNRAFAFGNSADKLVPGDYTGDGKTDIAFFHPSTGEWYVLRSEDSTFFAFPFGLSTDIPAPADYDGDGLTDPAVFRPSTTQWYINRSSEGQLIVNFGFAEDKPVVADYDGDGKADIAIFRPSVGQWWYLRSSDGTNRAFSFGNSSDKPVQGDYTGDGKADIAFWRPSDGNWYILRSEDSSFFSFPFGIPNDIPAPGDYDGDGKFDPAVFRPSATQWYINRSTSGQLIVNFGFPEDRPVPSAFIP